jgi:hypothetical protein
VEQAIHGATISTRQFRFEFEADQLKDMISGRRVPINELLAMMYVRDGSKTMNLMGQKLPMPRELLKKLVLILSRSKRRDPKII